MIGSQEVDDDMHITIDILSGHAAPWSGVFDQNVVTIGRSPEADVRLHPTKDTVCASRIHASLKAGDNGAMLLISEHENGVLLGPGSGGGRFLAKGEHAEILDAAEFSLGRNGPRLTVERADARIPTTMQDRDVRRSSQPVARIPTHVITSARRGKHLAIVGLSLAAVMGIGLILIFVRSRDLSSRLDALNQQRPRRAGASEQLAIALKRAGDSVALVGLESREHGFIPIGTAWTVAPGLMATNAHVATELQRGLDEGAKEIVGKRGSAQNVDLVFDSATTIHPAYEPWSRELSDQMVLVGDSAQHFQNVPVCDVAILHVSKGDCGAPLQLAEPADRPRPGDVIGYVGFPMEGIPGLPTPHVLTGSVTAVTDFFFQSPTAGGICLIHHDAKASGGASGSPLINDRGRVVALLSAGSLQTVKTTDGKEARIPVGLNYGQDVALLKELMAGKAAECQAARNPAWRQSEKQLFVRPSDRLRIEAVSIQTRLGRTLEPVEEKTLALDRRSLKVSQKVDLVAGYHYVLFATASDWSNLEIAARENDILINENDLASPMISIIISKSEQARSAQIELRARAARSDAPTVTLKVMRAKD